MIKCLVCDAELPPRRRKFCSNKCKGRENNNRYQNYEAQKARGLNRKNELLLLKGGKCQQCGYNKNMAALCFHHREPSEKKMRLDLRRLSNSKMSIILNEIEKCDLLCHNCHMEIHYPNSNLPIP